MTTGRASARPVPAPELDGPRAEKTVALALQGGGARGASTWGVLDALMEDGRPAIEAIAGASAGAMDAAVLVEGWLEGGPDGARAQLEAFRRKVGFDGALPPVQRRLFDQPPGFRGEGGPGRAWFGLWRRVASPYEADPLGIDPLRDALHGPIDFGRVRACRDARLFVAATSVWTGKVRVFEGPGLTADHLLASACLPTLFRAVEIDGEPYWDGGCTGDQALFPLFHEARTDDAVPVRIDPSERRRAPRAARGVHDRSTGITFNGPFLREPRAAGFVARPIDAGKFPEAGYKRVLPRRVDATGLLDDHPASSRSDPDRDVFLAPRDHGRRAARDRLARAFDALGRRPALDLRGAFG